MVCKLLQLQKEAVNGILKIISTENFLKVFINKDKRKNSLSLQLTSISGDKPN